MGEVWRGPPEIFYVKSEWDDIHRALSTFPMVRTKQAVAILLLALMVIILQVPKMSYYVLLSFLVFEAEFAKWIYEAIVGFCKGLGYQQNDCINPDDT